MSNSALETRMKSYENISRIYLTHRTPVILRLDGRSFHSFTSGFNRPFDDILIKSMQDTAKYLCENISGCKLAYTQSDEISLLLIDYDTINTQPWFDNNLQKLVSVSASMATMAFNKSFSHNYTEWLVSVQEESAVNKNFELHKHYTQSMEKGATFDSRAFILPKEEVCNYFICRQQDASRNSVQMVAQSQFSQKELHGKNCNALQDMLIEQKNINWNNLATVYKRGSCIIKEQYSTVDLSTYSGSVEEVTRSRWIVDTEIPIFTQDRDYVNKFVRIGE